MNDQEGQQKTGEEQTDAANNEIGPTEKLRETDFSEADTLVLGVPGAQNPDSKEIKNEKGPNTE